MGGYIHYDYVSKIMDNVLQVEEINNKVDKPKAPRIRKNKTKLYAVEQAEILDKFNKILGFEDSTNTIYKYDMDNNKEQKTKLLELIPDIKKYFNTRHWTFTNETQSAKENHIKLMLNLYKSLGYGVTSDLVNVDREGNKLRTTKYTIIRNTP